MYVYVCMYVCKEKVEVEVLVYNIVNSMKGQITTPMMKINENSFMHNQKQEERKKKGKKE